MESQKYNGNPKIMNSSQQKKGTNEELSKEKMMRLGIISERSF